MKILLIQMEINVGHIADQESGWFCYTQSEGFEDSQDTCCPTLLDLDRASNAALRDKFGTKVFVAVDAQHVSFKSEWLNPKDFQEVPNALSVALNIHRFYLGEIE